MRTVEIDTRDHLTLNVRVKFARTLRLRWWIGARLIALAAWIMRVGLEVELL